MKRFFLLLLCLIACTQVAEEPQKQEVVQEPIVVPEATAVDPFDSLLPTRTVSVSDGVTFKLTENNTLVHVASEKTSWDLRYQNERLSEFKGKEEVEFLYNQSRLSAVDFGAQKITFRYDSRGRVVEARGGQEPLYFDYDSLDQIRAVRRGVAGKTSLDYDKQGRIKYITKGLRTVNVLYDDKGRLRNFDGDDFKWIVGYWRDDKLISLTGKAFGRGIAVSYGPDYPPTHADMKGRDDEKVFTSAYTDTLYKVVDEYVYCTYVRQLKSLLFEGESYALFVNYFHKGMVDYLAMNVRCMVYE